MKELSHRTEHFTESVIRGMSRIARKFDAINLGQGYPEFAPPKEITDRLAEVASLPEYQQYPIGFGAPNTREALAKKYEHFSGQKRNPDEEVIITCGGTEAMVATILTLCDEGDKVAIFTPIYENYKTACMLAGAQPVYVPLHPENNFTFDANEVEETFKQGIKALILCNPSNPCGRVFTMQEMQILADLAIKYNVYIITDEVYEHMVYSPNKMMYMSTLPDMYERTIICGSLSKTYGITGWRLGYIIAPKVFADRAKKVHNFLTIGAPAPLQEAVIVGLKFPQKYYDDLLAKYTKKRDILLNGLKDLNIKYMEPEGTYFTLVDLTEQMKQNKAESDYDFAVKICEKLGICIVPTTTFFVGQKVNGLFRLHFAKNDDTIYEALNRLGNLKNL